MNIIKKTITKMKIKKRKVAKKYILTLYRRSAFSSLFLGEGEIPELFDNELKEYYIKKHIKLDKNKWTGIYINSKDFIKKMKKEKNSTIKFSKRFLRGRK